MIRALLTRIKLRALERQRALLVVRASDDAVPTQAVGALRKGIRLATVNGLLAAVDEAARARCEARLAEVLRMRGGA